MFTVNNNKQQEDKIQEWLDKGNKITILPYHGTKIRNVETE